MARAIYVDWDEPLGNQVKALLNNSGIECEWVSTGRDALSRLEKDPPDVVIAEIMMPDVSGFELCRRIRALDRGWETPVLLVSSMSAEEEVRHALSQGADDFISKPIHMPMLLQKVNHLLNADPPVAQPDPVTGLFNHRHMKYLIQRRLVKKEAFSVVCAELLNMVKRPATREETRPCGTSRGFWKPAERKCPTALPRPTWAADISYASCPRSMPSLLANPRTGYGQNTSPNSAKR